MIVVLVYSITLLIAVLVSDLARRSVLSTAVLFLLAGIAGAVFGYLPAMRPDNPVVGRFAELALVSVLFTDGMRTGLPELRKAWRLPGRALLLGLPLTLAGTALLAHWVVGLDWPRSFLMGAVLSPTDPVFAAALVGNERVPVRLRRLLNVESGLNDGLALPIVVVILSWLGQTHAPPQQAIGEVVLGALAGIVIPWGALRLERTRFFAATPLYQPLFGFAIILLIFAVSTLTSINTFIAAFVAGITVATVGGTIRQHFHDFAEQITELLKLAALLIFGGLISAPFLRSIGLNGYGFAILAILLVRPIAMMLSLFGSPLTWRERITAAWFGPKGFASVVFGLLVYNTHLAGRAELFHLIAVVVVGSILLHASTDILVTRWFHEEP